MVDYAPEIWARIGPELTALGERHFDEVDGGDEPGRPYKLHSHIIGLMCQSGALKIYSARDEGRLIGYIMWIITPDLESEGLTIAQMGPWFVVPGYFRVAQKLFRLSLEDMKRFGVSYVYPHHRMRGRGSNLGKFFERRGAKKIQHTYSLKIGER